MILTERGFLAVPHDKVGHRLNIRAQQSAQVAADKRRMKLPAFRLTRMWYDPAVVQAVTHVNMHKLRYNGKTYTVHRTYVDAYHDSVDPGTPETPAAQRVTLVGTYAA
ncbi:hypothetical protein SARC_07441 [Sphaeroforma arctica JP610]|uniref:Uncharacterized protein n=1 Tax=Sphaeroforma arctica JP610 TaxID=667725 RepID=A0A0L0FW73_9EUKA|nr:hypothetical protein SARC_07441 [Sphaeroforma arctica JP610]KNC80198.1 hypothetical protein SARC_07441 [Sphaeroforma arctica JP610]|eukprot:XP_014154100.1 hypothetical protein SARC_07441 [Sphaeroforma arctica JP610]